MSDLLSPDGRPDRDAVKRTLVLAFVIALVLGNVGGPVTGIVGALGTTAHEAGHAAVADVLTGRVLSVTVFPDGGGVTFSEGSRSWWRTFLVAGAGYPATLFAALGLLTAVLFARATRIVAAAASAVSAVTLVLWVPFSASVPAVDDGDQRFTFFLALLVTAAFAGVAALPDRWEHARRIGLGVLAVALLIDAFGAGSDLVFIEGNFGDTFSDADALAEAVGVGSSTMWAWALRGSLFVIAALWARWALARAGRLRPR